MRDRRKTLRRLKSFLPIDQIVEYQNVEKNITELTFRRIDQKEKLRSFSRNVAELSPKD